MKIRFEHVNKTYDQSVLQDVTLSIEDNKITALLGVSGRGKTTILRLLSGLEKPDGGIVSAEGRVGYLFQEPRLLPALTAYENVRLVAGSDERAKQALSLCIADGLAAKKPTEMSGGERQRVSLARLVAFGGDIWLLDEPFSALDADTKHRIIENLLPHFRKRTVLFVTHSTEEASIADAVIVL